MVSLKIENPIKFSGWMVIIGILCVGVAAPIFAATLARTSVFSQDGVEKPITSSSNIQDAFRQEISLSAQQKAHVRLSTTPSTTTVTIRIFPKDVVDGAGTADPDTLTGARNFIYCRPVYGSQADNCNAATTWSVDSTSGVYEIDFAGGYSGDQVVYMPGTYIVVVYGINTAGSNTKFNVSIWVDGPGELLSDIFTWVGLGLALGFAAILAILLIKKGVRA